MLETELRYAANCSPKVLCVAVVSMLQSLKNSRQGSLARPIDYYTDKNETEKKKKKKNTSEKNNHKKWTSLQQR